MCLHIISDYCFVGLLGLLVVVYLLLVGTVAGLVGGVAFVGRYYCVDFGLVCFVVFAVDGEWCCVNGC